MMQHQSLFGHLAARFSAHPENLAIEALNYILNSSVVAKQAFIHYITQADITFASNLMFQTQVSGKDNAIPDLVGVDSIGRPVVIVEAKFWAGLTDNQPVTYLKRLPSDANSIVLFIAPAQRFSTLWSELLRRCAISGFAATQQHTVGAEFLIGKIDTNRMLGLVSWRGILAFMLRVLDAEGQLAIVSDILQLQGLCERMDEKAFLPLRSEDLTADVGIRIGQFCQLVDDVTNRVVAEGYASVANLRASAGSGWYGRYLTLQGHGCLLHFNASRWSELRATPLWLRVKDREWKLTQRLRDALSSLEMEEPSRLLLIGDELLVPLYLPLGVEKDQVIEFLVRQVHEIASLLHAQDQAATP